MATATTLPMNAADIDPDLYQRLISAGQGFLDKLREAKADGTITVREAYGLLIDFSNKAVMVLDLYGAHLEGAQKKALAKAAAAVVFDMAYPFISTWGWLAFLRILPQPLVRAGFLALLDEAIEAAVRYRRS